MIVSFGDSSIDRRIARKGLHPLIAVSGLPVNPLIEVSRSEIHVCMGVSLLGLLVLLLLPGLL